MTCKRFSSLEGGSGSEGFYLSLVGLERHVVGELFLHFLLAEVVDVIESSPELLLDWLGGHGVELDLAKADGVEDSVAESEVVWLHGTLELSALGHHDELEGADSVQVADAAEASDIILRELAGFDSGVHGVLELVDTVVLPDSSEVGLIWDLSWDLVWEEDLVLL
jgi:hypothetical protein